MNTLVVTYTALTLPGRPDIVALLLADKRSPATKRAYASDLTDFFGGVPSPDTVHGFLAQSGPQIALRLAGYKGGMLAAGKSEATVNRRLAAIRSLLRLAHRMGCAQSDGRNVVDSEKVTVYRDTKGVDVKTIKRLIALPGQIHGEDSPHGRRDTALLRLLCENALRRAEVCKLDVGDFSLTESRLHIIGKGKGTQKAPVTVSPKLAACIAAYLIVAGHAADESGPLFRSLDRRPGHNGARLTPGGLYKMTGEYGGRLGVSLTPHKLRHSSITAALDASGGNVRDVQRLSRHAKLETLQRYDDNRRDLQGALSRQLSDLF